MGSSPGTQGYRESSGPEGKLGKLESLSEIKLSLQYCPSRPSILLKRGSSQYYVRERRAWCENCAEMYAFIQ